MNKIVTLLLFFGIYCSASAQEVYEFYDACGDSVGTKAEAAYFSTPVKKYGRKLYQKKEYFVTGELFADAYYKDAKADIANGMCRIYYKNGQLRYQVNFINNYYDGALTRYYKTGELACVERYNMGALIKCQCYTKAGSDTAYFEDRSQPRFPGGNDKYESYVVNLPLYKNYVNTSKKHGTVFVKTWFDDNGVVIKTKVIESPGDAEMENIAVEIIKSMPNWLPVLDEDDKPIKSARPIDVKF